MSEKPAKRSRTVRETPKRKPTKPHKSYYIPARPKKTKMVTFETSLPSCLIEKLHEKIINFYEKKGVHPTMDDIKRAKIVNKRGYYDGSYGFYLQIFVEQPNLKYDAELIVYKKALEKNKNAIAKYKKSMARYNERLKEYNIWLVKKKKKEALKKIEAVKKDIRKLNEEMVWE